MKKIKIILFQTLIIIGLVLVLPFMIYQVNLKNNDYKKEIGYHWELADKSSTIKEKSKHIDNFVLALSEADLNDTYDAILFKNPSNSFNKNYEVIKTLQTRLHQISKININSFEYQIALQQITEQEMTSSISNNQTSVIRGSWFLAHHHLLWNWLWVATLFTVIISLLGLLLWVDIQLHNNKYE